MIVRVELVLDGFLARDALGTQHLLDLKEHAVVVLEEHRHVRTEREAPRFFDALHASTKVIADLFVRAEIEELGALDLLHGSLASPAGIGA
jgi:hypothetical protein